MIEINDLSIAIGKRQIVNIPNLVFEKGKVSGIIGLNGSGKTTLLNSLSSYVKPTTGNILFEGELLTRTSVGFLETNNFFYSTITGREYLQIFDSPNDRFDVEKWKDILGLPIDSLISSYSTGMKKKLAFMYQIRNIFLNLASGRQRDEQRVCNNIAVGHLIFSLHLL